MNDACYETCLDAGHPEKVCYDPNRGGNESVCLDLSDDDDATTTTMSSGPGSRTKSKTTNTPTSKGPKSAYGGVGSAIPWHQDSYSWMEISPRDLISCWTSMDNATIENGCKCSRSLCVFRRS